MKILPGEDKAIDKKVKECHSVYKKRGAGGLIEMILRLFIEVRRLSMALENQKGNEGGEQ